MCEQNLISSFGENKWYFFKEHLQSDCVIWYKVFNHFVTLRCDLRQRKKNKIDLKPIHQTPSPNLTCHIHLHR